MYKPDEKDIDRLSREAAEHYHAPGKPAWDALQQVLDKELPQKEERKRRGFFFFFFLLMGLSLTGSVLWYGIQGSKNKQQLTPTTNIKDKRTEAALSSAASAGQPVIPAATNTEAVQPSANGSAKNDNANSSALASSSNADKPVAGTSALTDKAADNISNKATPASQQTTTARRPHTVDRSLAAAVVSTKNTRTTPTKSNKKINRTLAITGDAIAAGSKKATGKKSSRQEIPGNEDIAATGSRTIPKLQHGRIRKKTSSALASTEAGRDDATGNSIVSSGSKAEAAAKPTGNRQNEGTDTLAAPLADTGTTAFSKTTTIDSSQLTAIATSEKNDSAKAARKKKTSKNNKAVNIGLVAGMDISTVKFTHGDNAGYNFGLMAGYQFNRRWSVYTGIVYTKKNYKLDGSDYHPPKHYWTQYVKLEEVEGYCRMWELPLQVRYTFNPGAKTAFFASTGLSSYFMKKQQYNYSYKNNMNQQLTAAWSNDSTFKHVFSILHLSAGFEKPLGKHMNWQIEPYAKIPLGGVGFGNIRLSSFGVNFSVQYRQRIRR